MNNNTVVAALILLLTAEICKAEPSLELLFPRVWRCPQLHITIELNASWVITQKKKDVVIPALPKEI